MFRCISSTASLLQPDRVDLSVIYSETTVGKEFIVFSKRNKPCQDDVKIINDFHKKLHGNNIHVQYV